MRHSQRTSFKEGGTTCTQLRSVEDRGVPEQVWLECSEQGEMSSRKGWAAFLKLSSVDILSWIILGLGSCPVVVECVLAVSLSSAY